MPGSSHPPAPAQNPLHSPCSGSCSHTQGLLAQQLGESENKVNHCLSRPCSASFSTFLPITLGLKSQPLTTVWQASGMQVRPDHPPLSMSTSPGAPWASATLAFWDTLPGMFCLRISQGSSPPPPSPSLLGGWLTRGLPKHTSAATPYLSPQVPTWCYILHLLLVCVSLTCHLTWTVHCRHTSMAGPGKTLNTHLAITLLNRSPAPRSAKNAPTPTTGHSYLPKTYEIRTNHVSGVSVNHSANTSGCGVYVHTRPRTLELQHPHPLLL